MEKVEEDLARSKNLREKQAKEFSRQLEDLRIKHEKEVCFFFGCEISSVKLFSKSSHSRERIGVSFSSEPSYCYF